MSGRPRRCQLTPSKECEFSNIVRHISIACLVTQTMVVREHWSGAPERLGRAWTLHKHPMAATCTIWSHHHGWELRLVVGHEQVRSELVESNEQLVDVAMAWREALIQEGWQG